MKTITKKELANAVVENVDVQNNLASQAVDCLFQTMRDHLIDGDRIEIRGFGSFVVKDYQAYMGRNPKTGEVIKVKPKKLPFFKVGKELRDKVNSGD